MEDIVQRIKELMKYHELNISETASRTGISQPNLSAILSGKRPIGINTINKFIISFDINKEWLEKGIGEMYDLETKQLGTRIFIIRNKRKWTAKETADFLKIPISDFHDIEKGKLIPDKCTIDNFISISGANPAWIYSGKGEKFQDWYIKHTSAKEDNDAKRESIIDRIEFLMKSANMTHSDIAIKCKIEQSKLADFFQGKELKNSDYILSLIASSIGANKKWILTGEGSPFDTKSSFANEYTKTTAQLATRPRIPYTAAAGSLTDAPDGITMKDCEQIPVIHQFPSYDFTMLIKGDSMSPKYESGDEVACRKIDQKRYIQWGKVHVLDTTQGIIIKRVYEDGDKIRCVSYNKEYADFSIPKEDIYSMSLVVGVLSITEM